jgi:cytochrome b561
VSARLRYSPVAMTLHWLIAALVIIDFGLGVSFGQFNPGDTLYSPSAYRLHMSTGMAVMIASLACVLWRLTHRYPSLPPDMHVATRLLARTAHLLLYLFIIVVPLTGWAVLSLRKSPPALYGSINWPNIALLADLARERRGSLHDLVLPVHVALSYAGIGLVGLHVMAALHHHFLRRDDVLRRMLPGSKFRPAHPP